MPAQPAVVPVKISAAHRKPYEPIKMAMGTGIGNDGSPWSVASCGRAMIHVKANAKVRIARTGCPRMARLIPLEGTWRLVKARVDMVIFLLRCLHDDTVRTFPMSSGSFPTFPGASPDTVPTRRVTRRVGSTILPPIGFWLHRERGARHGIRGERETKVLSVEDQISHKDSHAPITVLRYTQQGRPALWIKS